jgi:hypothetical protein
MVEVAALPRGDLELPMSAPPENARPAPVKITTRVS